MIKCRGKNITQAYSHRLDFVKFWNDRFFWIEEKFFPSPIEWHHEAPQDEMPKAGTDYAKDVATLESHRTKIQKLPELFLCAVGLSPNYHLEEDVYPTFLNASGQGGCLNNNKIIEKGT